MRRTGQLTCLLVALTVPLLAVAESPPPGAKPPDGDNYTIESITGRSGAVVYGRACKSGRFECQDNWQALCGGKPAIDSDWQGYAERGAQYSTHNGKSIRLFVCNAMVRRQNEEFEAGLAFVTFIQSISAQKGARMCERGIPGYRQQFDDLYTRWSAKHRERIARGEALFREALSKKDRPHTDRAKLERIGKAIAELAEGPHDSRPITLDHRTLVDCEGNLSELEIGIKYPPFGRERQ